MNENQWGGRANIGMSSLILIFIVLCLTVFGLLSLSSAGSDWKLARKNAEAVRGYYKAGSGIFGYGGGSTFTLQSGG